jgi:hypothetical protein
VTTTLYVRCVACGVRYFPDYGHDRCQPCRAAAQAEQTRAEMEHLVGDIGPDKAAALVTALVAALPAVIRHDLILGLVKRHCAA